MRIENFLFGILACIIGGIGIIHSLRIRSRSKDDILGLTIKYLFGSIGFALLGWLLVIKEISKLF